MLDVVIVGGGPAGLSAALVLGPVPAIGAGLRHRPAAQLRLARDARLSDARRHAAVRVPGRRARASSRNTTPCSCATSRSPPRSASRAARFKVTLATGEELESRKLLVATGVADKVPDIPGFADLYGRSVFHCPYCDGWEVRDTPLAIYGRGRRGYGLSLELTGWSRDLVLCTDGPCELDDEQRGEARTQRHPGARGSRRASRRRGWRPAARRLRVRRAPAAPRAVLQHRPGAAVRPLAAPRLRDQREGHRAHRPVRGDPPARASTSPATPRAPCSGSSSRPPKGRKRRLRSIRISSRASFDERAARLEALGYGPVCAVARAASRRSLRFSRFRLAW